MKVVDWIAGLLVVLGSLNWGIIGLFNLNVIAYVGGATLFPTIAYILIGLAGIWKAVCLFGCCKVCCK